MNAVAMAAVVQLSLLAGTESDYASAYKAHQESGRPLVVLVGADWCPGCRQMHDSTIPQAQQNGLLNDVEFVYVNTDRQHSLASKIMQGGSIPQLVMYHETEEGFQREQLTGAQSLGAIRSFVRRGVERASKVRQAAHTE
ncbi:MAG: thioredoxin family protein [Pirellulales bacterium]|nr:thioredoxin family protein [Planctomycetales bacterium]